MSWVLELNKFISFLPDWPKRSHFSSTSQHAPEHRVQGSGAGARSTWVDSVHSVEDKRGLRKRWESLKNKNWHEPKRPNSPGATAQGIDRQPQFCSAEHVNLIARERKLKFSWYVVWLSSSTTFQAISGVNPIFCTHSTIMGFNNQGIHAVFIPKTAACIWPSYGS